MCLHARIQLKMAKLPDAFLLSAAYWQSDGSCRFEHVPVVLCYFCSAANLPFGGLCPWCASVSLSSSTSEASDEDGEPHQLRRLRNENRTAKIFQLALRTMCLLAQTSDFSDAMEFDSRLFVRVERIPLLSGCRVGENAEAMEKFGAKVKHWRRLFQYSGWLPNVVMFCTGSSRFFVVSSRPRCTQAVDTRSALCWIRQGCGPGYCAGAEGVFHLKVGRQPPDDDEAGSQDLLEAFVEGLDQAFPYVTWEQ